MKEIIKQDELAADMQKLGIQSGDKLMVHSSLKSIGIVDGGADTVIDALIETVGEDGLIMMPTFSYCYESRSGAVPFHKERTPSLTGYVTEVFRKRRNVQRSMHPTHSVAVWGKNAREYILGHDETAAPFDWDTPVYRLAAKGGRILMIGTGHESNSTIHVAEFLADLPFLDIPNKESYGKNYIIEAKDGSVVRIPFPRKLSGCSHGFGKVETIQAVKNIQKTGFIGRAECRLINAWELLEILVPVLKKQPGFLLCENNLCEGCSKRRRRLGV